jgi:hypothetical protein
MKSFKKYVLRLVSVAMVTLVIAAAPLSSVSNAAASQGVCIQPFDFEHPIVVELDED